MIGCFLAVAVLLLVVLLLHASVDKCDWLCTALSFLPPFPSPAAAAAAAADVKRMKRKALIRLADARSLR